MMMPIALAMLGGLIAGSFLNVVAYRLPLGESLVAPSSRCTSCGVPIRPYDNIPVLGWLLLRGRCRACHAAISARYPIVEAVTAARAIAVVLVKHSAYEITLGLVLVAVLVPITLIDYDRRVIPNKITLPASVAAIVIGLVLAPAKVPGQLIAGAAAGGFLLVFALAYPRGMGMGDVKLAAMMGLFLGSAVAPALLVALLSGVLAGAIVIARKGVLAGRKTAVPFGPFLALGALVAVFLGHKLVDVYVNHFLH
jgi:leader peptidase (prepilin peptidase)/N-methyltransferase